MAPESETLKYACKCEHPYEGTRAVGMPNRCERCRGLIVPNEPTLTCSEVVERLAAYIVDDLLERHPKSAWKHYIERALHSWRERRVQELETNIWREAFRSALAFSSPSPRDGSHRRGDKIFSRMMELEWEANDKCGRELTTTAGDDAKRD